MHLQPTSLPPDLRQALRTFDRSNLRPAGTPHLASRAVHPLMPDAHGFVFVGEPGGHTRLYSHGQQAARFWLRRGRVKRFEAQSAAAGTPFPAALHRALRERVGKPFACLEALLEDLRTGTDATEPMPMPWQDFGACYLAPLCRSSAQDFVLAAKPAGVRVTWAGVVLHPPQLQRLRAVISAPVCAALAPLCGQPFADAATLLQAACPQPDDAPRQAIWRAWVEALHENTQHCMGSARSGHALDQDDEEHLRAHPTLRCRAYPTLPHAFVRDAWRQLFWGREYLRECMVGLRAFTAEEAEVQRRRMAPEWMRYVPGSTPDAIPSAWFVGHMERLPAYHGMQNCNTAAAALLVEAAHLQRMHAQREGLPEPPTLTIQGPSWRNWGIHRPLAVWRPVRCDAADESAVRPPAA